MSAGVDLPKDAPDWALVMAAQLARVQESIALLGQAPGRTELTTKEAMARLGYKSGKRFWEAVRRLAIPYSKLSAHHYVFNSADIAAVLEAKRVGVRRPGTRMLAA